MKKTDLHILMLEDEPCDAELNKEQLFLLEEYNCNVDVVSGKKQFLQALDNFHYDIILSDFNLPQYNGIEALNDYKVRNLLVPFIFVTGTINEETAAETIKSGAWDYVVKDRLIRLPLAIRSALKLKEEKLMVAATEKKINHLIAAIDQTSVQIIVLNEFYKVEYVNKKFTETTSLTVKDLSEENTFTDLHLGNVFKHIKSPTRNQVYRGEEQSKLQDGSDSWKLITITPIIDDAGDNSGYVVVKEDITLQKITEQTLTNALQRAENSDRLKDAFLHNLSHEIRTPLNAIVGFSELLKDNEISLPETVRDYASIIQKSSNQLLSIVTDVLTMASIQTGHETVVNTKVNLDSLTGLIFASFNPTAEHKKLNFVIKRNNSDVPEFFMSDQTKVTQIISNLLENAFKFTSEGQIELSCDCVDGFLKFYVKDTGIGIPLAAQKYIFERFRQADNDIHVKYGGTGLGLSICKSYAEMLGGSLSLISYPGVGSEFCLSIPYVQPPDTVKDEKTDKSMKSPNLTILVAEDEIYNFELIEAFLRITEINLLYATNGYEALKLCENNKFIDLVLMDIKMPIMDGITALKEIRKVRRDLPILAVTAYALENEKEKFLDLGFNDYISKPIKKEILIESIFNNLLVK
jgi:PAS domain S-box-containing protein